MLGLLPPTPPTSLPADLKVEYRAKEGLFVTFDGVPVLQGSFVQLFRASDGKGLFSSRSVDTKVTPTAEGYHAEYTSADVSGTVDVRLNGRDVETKHHVVWNGDVPATVELVAGLLYAEPWRNAVQTPPVPKNRPARKADEVEGRLLSHGESVLFESSRAALSIKGGPELTLFDGDGYIGDWARGTSRYWSGYRALPIVRGTPVDVTTTYRFVGGFAEGTPKVTTKLVSRALPNAAGPIESRPPLIPRPSSIRIDYGTKVELTGAWSFPAGRPRRFDEFRAALARRFEIPAADPKAKPLPVDGGLHDFKLLPGSYELTITPTSLTILGQDDEGMLSAIERLASLAFVEDGKLYLPTGTLRDVPKREFRGVHLFVGPEARAFQSRLWTRVLRPLGLNRVVLQCERTAWDALPGQRGPGIMPKTELTALAKWYRSRTVEPIPLVQSFGHMEWLFAGGASKDLAFDPERPTAIDPRKPGQKDLLNRIWDEAAVSTGAKILHFGLDEIDLAGGPQDPGLVSELWRTQLVFLSSIAARRGARPMLWGDMALAPDEATDAANGVDRETAALRRDAIPRNAIVADWHYKADARPATFVRSLQTWKTAGLQPVAASWSRPENVRGLTLAADLERTGTLQTTWAGYQSSEAAMLGAMDQFSAMVLAADYSWSGRQEAVDRLGYDPIEVFRRMYFDAPTPIRPVAGLSLTIASGGAGAGSNAPSPEAIELGRRTGVNVAPFVAPIALRNLETDGPMEAELPLTSPVAGKRLYLQANVATRLQEGDPVAKIVVRLIGGKTIERTVRYGLDVVVTGDRSTTRRSPSYNGLSLIALDLPEAARVTGLEIVASAPHSGFVLRGVTVR